MAILNKVVSLKAKGFLPMSIGIIFILGLSFAVLTANSASHSLTNRKISQLNSRYMAENVIEIEKHLLRNYLDNLTDLSVVYVHAINPMTGARVTQPIDSSQIFGTAEVNYATLCKEALDVVKQAGGSRSIIKASLYVDSLDDFLTLEDLDKTGALSRITNTTTGELAPVVFTHELQYNKTLRLIVETEISGVTFETITNASNDAFGYSLLMVKLNTDNIQTKCLKFQWFESLV